jgi:hypothetical protein
MEITGILVKQTSIREGVSKTNGNPWKIAEYLLEVPGQYPRHINFRVSDGQVGRIARFESLIGKTVTVSFDIDAREHEGRWYNEINAWGILEYINQTQRAANMVAAQNAGPAPQTGAAPFPPQVDANGNPIKDKDDDLPF